LINCDPCFLSSSYLNEIPSEPKHRREKKKVADLLAWWRISRLLLFDPMQGQTMRARDNNSMDSSKREMIFLQQKKIELIQRSTLQLKSMEVRSIC
jgi:hypothetical protein